MTLTTRDKMEEEFLTLPKEDLISMVRSLTYEKIELKEELEGVKLGLSVQKDLHNVFIEARDKSIKQLESEIKKLITLLNYYREKESLQNE